MFRANFALGSRKKAFQTVDIPPSCAFCKAFASVELHGYALSMHTISGTQPTLALPHDCHHTLNASAFMQTRGSALDHCNN